MGYKNGQVWWQHVKCKMAPAKPLRNLLDFGTPPRNENLQSMRQEWAGHGN